MPLIVRLAWRNLWRHSRRTWLTTGAMIFSNVLLIFMITFQFETYEMMTENTLKMLTGHAQIQQKDYLDEPRIYRTIPNITKLAEDIRQQPSNLNVAARSSGFALLSSEQRSFGAQILGVEPEQESKLSTLPGLIKKGRYLDAKIKAAIPQIVIGSTMARNLKINLGDELTLLGSGKDGSFAAGVFSVVGIFESGIQDIDRSVAQIHLTQFQEVFSMGNDGHYIVLTGENNEDLNAIINTVTPLLPENSVLQDWDALQPGLKQAIQADMASSWLMYGVLIILVAFSVLNTQLMSVLERTREFGIIMAVGLTPGKLARLVILESFLMASIGLVIGIFLGLLLTLWIGHVGLTFPGMEEMAARFNLPARLYPNVSLLALLLGPACVFVFSVLAAIYPALRLYLLQPLDAMRSA